MHFSTFLTAAVSLLCASAYAAPIAGADPPFRINGLQVIKDSTYGGNVSISFTVHDPSKYGKGATTCNGTWPAGSKGFPQGSYKSCANDSFAWNMQSFTTVQQFTLGLEHLYADPLIGEPPYNFVDTYAAGNITTATSQCATSGLIMTCHQLPSNVVLAPVYATSA